MYVNRSLRTLTVANDPPHRFRAAQPVTDARTHGRGESDNHPKIAGGGKKPLNPMFVSVIACLTVIGKISFNTSIQLYIFFLEEDICF